MACYLHLPNNQILSILFYSNTQEASFAEKVECLGTGRHQPNRSILRSHLRDVVALTRVVLTPYVSYFRQHSVQALVSIGMIYRIIFLGGFKKALPHSYHGRFMLENPFRRLSKLM